MKQVIPVTFKDPKSCNSSPYTLDMATGQIIRAKIKSESENLSYTMNCEVVFGDCINIITIKGILSDERGIEDCRRKYLSDQRDEKDEPVYSKDKIESKIKESKSDPEDLLGAPFGISVRINDACTPRDKNGRLIKNENGNPIQATALLAHQEIKAITILDKWREPDKILKTTPHTTSAAAWLGRYGNVCVVIELADGTILRGNIEPRLKEERQQLEKKELSEFSERQTRELKNAQEQLLIGFAKNLAILIKCINQDEMQLIYDYTECNGVLNQIATMREKRGEKKANRVSVTTDVQNLIKKFPPIYTILQGIKTHTTLAKIKYVPDIDKQSVRVNYPAALAKAKAIIDPTGDDLESVINPHKKGETLERIFGEDKLEEIFDDNNNEEVKSENKS